YRQIRPILVKRLGESVVSGLEKTFEFLRLFLTEGFAGVWREFLEWVGDLKGIVIQAVTEWVVTKIVMAGLSRLATLWNPVGWAVEAVMAIYNTVMFFIERMEQILDFVEAVIQSINNIATGKLQQAADYVEGAMARTIPVIISFCTSLIGLGGISSKIRGVIQKVQDKVHKAIDTMIEWIVKRGRMLLGGEKDTPESTEVKEEARTRLNQVLPKQAPLPVIQQKIAGVLSDLLPKGLRALGVREGDDGTKRIFAEASPLEDLFLLDIPDAGRLGSKGGTEENPTVRIAAEVAADPPGPGEETTALDDPAAAIAEGVEIPGTRKTSIETIFEGEPDAKVKVRQVYSFIYLWPNHPLALDIKRKLGRTPKAPPQVLYKPGEIELPKTLPTAVRFYSALLIAGPQPSEAEGGGSAIRMLAYNSRGGSGCDSNSSHAEPQFTTWFGQQDAAWRRRVRSIQLIINPYSPCDLCTGTLVTFLKAENADRPRPIVASVSWSEVYGTDEDRAREGGRACRTSAGVSSALSRAGWQPSGPEPPSALPTPPDPTKEEKVEPPVEVKPVSGAGASRSGVIRRPGKTQRKAASGLANDPLEREADHVADLIVASRESAMPLALGITPLPQRAPQRTGKPSDVHHYTSVNLPRTPDTVGTPSPIAPAVRRPLERRFGADFSRVRVHDGAGAANLCRDYDARAFTQGSNIYFASGEYETQSRRGRHLLAHELTHVVQQTSPGATPAIQRQAGPAHDLTAPGLSGEPKLEEIFDEKDSLGPPKKGPGVKKVQEALVALGFTLPKFGADGEYGSETRQAVREFQTKAGLTGAQVDGIVGPVTLGLLDRASRQGSVTNDTDPAEHDLKVTGKATSKLEDHLNKDGTPKEPVRVFFEFDSDKVASDEKDKLKALHDKFPAQPLTLKGLASEEGAASYNLALAERRREAVKSVLRDEHKHDSALLVDHPSEVAKGNIEYKEMRAVDVAIGSTAFKAESIVDTKTKASTACTEEESKKVTEAVQKAAPEGVKWIADARKELPPTKQTTTDLFDKLFGVRAVDPNTRAAERGSAVSKVNRILDKLSPHLDNTKRPCATDADLAAGGCHVCRNEQDGGCASGSPAYNRDPSPQTAGITHVCTSFVGESFDEQITILIHEGHHGTPGIPSSDLAYSHTRLITAVNTSSALENAASFHLYIGLVKRPGSVEVGHEKTQDVRVGLSDAEFATIQTLLGLLEQWFSLSTFDLSNVYAAIRRARAFGAWRSEDETIRFAGMGRVAPRFGLTPPEFLPIERDQTGLAAIYNRFQTMERGVKQQLTIEKTATGPSAWDRGPGRSLKLPAAFFAEPRNKQMTWLMQELVSATPDISAGLEPRYVALIDDLRLARDLPLNP
ncbi:MAG: DUF4157 domain-containing protein, partial [Terrimicrobiaceae bacterium]